MSAMMDAKLKSRKLYAEEIVNFGNRNSIETFDENGGDWVLCAKKDRAAYLKVRTGVTIPRATGFRILIEAAGFMRFGKFDEEIVVDVIIREGGMISKGSLIGEYDIVKVR
jgi:hypothetical protein